MTPTMQADRLLLRPRCSVCSPFDPHDNPVMVTGTRSTPTTIALFPMRR